MQTIVNYNDLVHQNFSTEKFIGITLSELIADKEYTLTHVDDHITVASDEVVYSYLFDRKRYTVLDAITKAIELNNKRIERADVFGASPEEVDAAFENRITITAKAELIGEDDPRRESIVKAADKQNIDADLMPVEFKLVHANANLNKDQFLESELRAAKDTPKYKPINWSHSKTIIGVMVDSRLVNATLAEDMHIVVDGVVYELIFPEYAEEMRKRFSKGELYFSMEVWFKEAECSECHNKAASSKDYCDHLKNRFATGSTTSRILRDLIFFGVGVVENPADPEAEGLSLGTKEEKIMKEQDGVITFDSQAELDAYVADKATRAAALDRANAKVAELQSQVDALNTKIEELSAAKAEAENQAQSEVEKLAQESTAKDARIVELESELEKVSNEYREYAAVVEGEKRLAARVAELSEAGIVITDNEIGAQLQEKLSAWSDEEYNLYKGLALSAVAAKAADVNEEEVPDAPESAQVDVPTAQANAQDEGKFPALRKILKNHSK